MTNIVTPLRVGTVTRAVVATLKADARLAAVQVTRSEDENIDPNACPWVGVYRLNSDLTRRVLSGIDGHRGQDIELLVLMTHSSPESGEVCEDLLDELIEHVTSALLTDTTLGGVVLTLEDFSINFTRYALNGSYYMQTAALQFKAITNTIITGG